MRILLPLLLSSVFCVQLLGQQIELRKDTIQVPFQVSQNRDQLLSIQIDTENIFSTSHRVELIPNKQLRLEDGDLIFDYEVKKLENNFYYDIHFHLLSEDGTPMLFKARQLKGNEGKINPKMDTKQQRIWRDVTENDLFYNREYRLEIVNELWGDGLNCSKKQSLGSKQQWPYWLSGAIGAGLVGLGEFKKSDAKRIYLRYEMLWINGNEKAEGVKVFAGFDNKKQAYRNFTAAGLAVLAVDGFFYALRLKKHWKEVRLFNKYCKIDVSLLQKDLPNDLTGGNHLSLGLNLIF